MLHDKLFGLFEAMSAIEMMDPKMDAGMIGNQVNRKVLNFEQAIKDGTIKMKDLTLPELIGIMDTCFCCLVRVKIALFVNFRAVAYLNYSLKVYTPSLNMKYI